MSLEQVAAAFWPTVKDSEIADVLFAHARHFRRNRAGIGPSAPVAKRYYKGDLAHVGAIVADEHADPEVLRKFAKDTRVAVRQRLLENPATPRDVLCDLSVWKLERGDHDRAETVDRLTLEELLEVLGRLRDKHGDTRVAYLDLNGSAVAQRCLTRPDLVGRLVESRNIGITVALAARTHRGDITSMSLTEMLQAHPEAAKNAIAAILTERTLLTQEFASLWRQWQVDPDNRRYHRHLGMSDTPFTIVEEGAADILVDGDIAQLHTAIVNGASEERLIERFTTLTREEIKEGVIAALTKRTVSPTAEATLAGRLTEIRATDPGDRLRVSDLLKVLTHPLPDGVLLDLLRTGGPGCTAWWLESNRHPCAPRPGMLRALRARPGRSFGETAQEVDLLRGYAIAAAATNPELLADIVEAYDHHLGENLANATVARAVYPLIERTFAGPDRRAAWETFLTLAGDWSGTLTGLLDAVVGLLGLDPTAESTVEDASVTQLSLV